MTRAVLASAALHAVAAVALASVQDRREGVAVSPEPPALVVALVAPADLVPATPPPAPAEAPEAPVPLAVTDAPPLLPQAMSGMPPPAARMPAPMPLMAPPPAPEDLTAPDLTPPPDLRLAEALPRPKPRPERAPEPAAESAAKPAAKPAAKAVKAAKAVDEPAAASPTAAPKAAAKPSGKPAGGADVASLKAEWGGAVRARIERKKAYPADAAGAAGTVKVRLTLAPSGKLSGVTVTASSGNAALDAAAVRAVKAAGRFPAAPAGLTDASYSFTLPMRFAP